MQRWFARQEPPPGSQMKGKGKAEPVGVTQIHARTGLQPVFYRYRCFTGTGVFTVLLLLSFLGVFSYLCSLGNFNCSVIK